MFRHQSLPRLQKRWFGTVLLLLLGIGTITPAARASTHGAWLDYDGDGKTDFALFRPSESRWHVLESSTGAEALLQFGTIGDIPVPGDYDGDGITDHAVFRPSNGSWYVLLSSNGAFVTELLWAPGDIPAPGDFDGDGKTDFAAFRPSDGSWHI